MSRTHDPSGRPGIDAAAAARPPDALTPAEEAALVDADPALVACLRNLRLPGVPALHLEAGAAPGFEVDGAVRRTNDPPWSEDRVRTALESLLSPTQRARIQRDPGLEFRFAVTPEQRFHVRVRRRPGPLTAEFRILPEG